MIDIINTMKQLLTLLIFSVLISISAFSQLTHSFTDAEKNFKEASELFKNQQYGVAYPLLQELKFQNTQHANQYPTYWVEDLDFFYIVTGLKLSIPIAEDQAAQYLKWILNMV